jgi:hypothetical protein
MNKTLKSFVDYCEKHPQERFYQALRNWSGFNFIYGSHKPIDDLSISDTFYIEDEK